VRNEFLPRRVFSVALVLALAVLAVVLLDQSPLRSRHETSVTPAPLWQA